MRPADARPPLYKIHAVLVLDKDGRNAAPPQASSQAGSGGASGGASSRVIVAEYELSQFGYFQRGPAQEFMTFTSKTLVERTGPGQRQLLEQDEYRVHCYCLPGPPGGGVVAAVLITGKDYPQRVAFGCLSKLLEEYRSQPAGVTPARLRTDYINKYCRPQDADAMMQVQAELDETKVVLHKTINSVLERGEKLDDLVQRSNELSMQSKAFYKTAKSTNSCCTYM